MRSLPVASKPRSGLGTHSALLWCGALSSLYYAIVNAVVPAFDPSYNWITQTVSELSAVNAPTRALWVLLLIPYTALILAFGWGVWRLPGASRGLCFVGLAFLIQGAIGPFWPPMHLRNVIAAGGGTLTDTLHIAFTAVWGALAISAMVAGALAIGGRFRSYTWLSLGVLLIAGALTSAQAGALQAGLPTPTIGVWERVNMAAAMLWVAVLSIKLAKGPTQPLS